MAVAFHHNRLAAQEGPWTEFKNWADRQTNRHKRGVVALQRTRLSEWRAVDVMQSQEEQDCQLKFVRGLRLLLLPLQSTDDDDDDV